MCAGKAVDLAAVIDVVRVQLRRMDDIMSHEDDPDEASIAYLLLMDKVRPLLLVVSRPARNCGLSRSFYDCCACPDYQVKELKTNSPVDEQAKHGARPPVSL